MAETQLVRLAQIFVNPRNNGFPILVLIIGAMGMYWGYSLFMSGVTEGGAALKIGYGDQTSFEMGKGGPGLVFSAFGMIMVVVSIWKFGSLRVQTDENVATSD